MTRIAIIGNSHVGALRRAWSDIGSEHPDLDVVFLAAPQLFAERCRIRDGHFFGLCEERTPAKTLRRLRTINGITEIDLSTCDHVVEVGREFGLSSLVRLLAAADVDGLRETGSPTRLSRPAFMAFLQSVTEERLATEWRAWGRGLLVILQPMLAETHLEGTAELAPLLHDSTGLPAAITELTRLVIRQWADVNGTVLEQPPETIGPTGLTLRRYRYAESDATGRERRDVSDDNRHMGRDFANLQWAQILSAIGTQSPATAAT